jgi:hypothetical protein
MGRLLWMCAATGGEGLCAFCVTWRLRRNSISRRAPAASRPGFGCVFCEC